MRESQRKGQTHLTFHVRVCVYAFRHAHVHTRMTYNISGPHCVVITVFRQPVLAEEEEEEEGEEEKEEEEEEDLNRISTRRCYERRTTARYRIAPV